MVNTCMDFALDAKNSLHIDRQKTPWLQLKRELTMAPVLSSETCLYLLLLSHATRWQQSATVVSFLPLVQKMDNSIFKIQFSRGPCLHSSTKYHSYQPRRNAIPHLYTLLHKKYSGGSFDLYINGSPVLPK